MKLLALTGWLVAAAALYMARYSLALAVESAAEAREAQLISCELMQTQARLLGWDLAPDCGHVRDIIRPR
jgi:hypothetical protein